MIDKIKCFFKGHQWEEWGKIGTELRVQKHHFIEEGFIYLYGCERCGKNEFRNGRGRVIK